MTTRNGSAKPHSRELAGALGAALLLVAFGCQAGYTTHAEATVDDGNVILGFPADGIASAGATNDTRIAYASLDTNKGIVRSYATADDATGQPAGSGAYVLDLFTYHGQTPQNIWVRMHVDGSLSAGQTAGSQAHFLAAVGPESQELQLAGPGTQQSFNFNLFWDLGVLQPGDTLGIPYSLQSDALGSAASDFSSTGVISFGLWTGEDIVNLGTDDYITSNSGYDSRLNPVPEPSVAALLALGAAALWRRRRQSAA